MFFLNTTFFTSIWEMNYNVGRISKKVLKLGIGEIAAGAGFKQPAEKKKTLFLGTKMGRGRRETGFSKLDL